MRKIYLLLIPVGCFISGSLVSSQVAPAEQESVSPKQSQYIRTDLLDEELMLTQADPNLMATANQIRLQEDLALARFRIIQRQLLELSTKYPQTAAGKRAQEIIEQQNLSILANYGFGPEDCFVEGVPVCRFRFCNSISKK